MAAMICCFSGLIVVITLPRKAKEPFSIPTRAALDAALVVELDGASFPVERTTLLSILKA